MRISLLWIALCLALAATAAPSAAAGIPVVRSVEPDSGKTGEMMTVAGENIGPETIAALYLTDGANDIKVAILEQTATSIRFRIPAEAKPGRFSLMVLTKEKEPRLMEQPVKVTVEPQT